MLAPFQFLFRQAAGAVMKTDARRVKTHGELSLVMFQHEIWQQLLKQGSRVFAMEPPVMPCLVNTIVPLVMMDRSAETMNEPVDDSLVSIGDYEDRQETARRRRETDVSFAVDHTCRVGEFGRRDTRPIIGSVESGVEARTADSTHRMAAKDAAAVSTSRFGLVRIADTAQSARAVNQAFAAGGTRVHPQTIPAICVAGVET